MKNVVLRNKNKMMKKNLVSQSRKNTPRQLAVHYMKTLVDVARESFLILGEDLKIISANPIFYRVFHTSPEQTEGELIYDLGNGQWNIPELKKLLQEILPEKKSVENYEVNHVFPTIGRKTMLLNAGQIDSAQLIILAIEDITERKQLEEELAKYTKKLEVEVKKRTAELADRVTELERMNKTMTGRECKMAELKKEIDELKKPAQK